MEHTAWGPMAHPVVTSSRRPGRSCGHVGAARGQERGPTRMQPLPGGEAPGSWRERGGGGRHWGSVCDSAPTRRAFQGFLALTPGTDASRERRTQGWTLLEVPGAWHLQTCPPAASQPGTPARARGAGGQFFPVTVALGVWASAGQAQALSTRTPAEASQERGPVLALASIRPEEEAVCPHLRGVPPVSSPIT